MFAVPVLHVFVYCWSAGKMRWNFQLQYLKWPLGAAEHITITLTANMTYCNSVLLWTSECVWRGTFQHSRGKHSKAASCGAVLVYVVHL